MLASKQCHRLQNKIQFIKFMRYVEKRVSRNLIPFYTNTILNLIPKGQCFIIH